MGDRIVPFDEDAICDVCGAKGAYDFMGDLICPKCVDDGGDDNVEMEFEDTDIQGVEIHNDEFTCPTWDNGCHCYDYSHLEIAECLNKEMISHGGTVNLLQMEKAKSKSLNEKLDKVAELIRDMKLADEPLKVCHDSGHDERWCSYCSARSDGIDEYQTLLMEKLNKILDE